MIPYYILFVLILLCGLYNKCTAQNRYGQLYAYKSVARRLLDYTIGNYIVVFIVFVILATFRDFTVGLDTKNYFSFYHYIPLSIDEIITFSSFEPGYRFFNILAKALGLGYSGVQLFVSILVTYGFARFINKFSADKCISWLLFLSLGIYAQSLNIMRQMCAVAIILIAVIKLSERKYLWFVVLVGMASLFHVSAVFALVLLPLWLIPLNNITVAIYGALTCVLSVAFMPIITLLDKVIGGRYLHYIIEGNYFETTSTANILFTVGLLAVFVLMYIFRRKLASEDKNTDRWLSIFMIMPLIRAFGSAICYPTLTNRLSPYFFFAIIILVPTYLRGIKDKYNKWYSYIFIALVVACLVYMYLYYAVRLACGVVPYEMYLLM